MKQVDEEITDEGYRFHRRAPEESIYRNICKLSSKSGTTYSEGQRFSLGEWAELLPALLLRARIKSFREPPGGRRPRIYDANIRDELLIAALKRIAGLPLDTPFSEVLRIGLQEIHNEYKRLARKRTSKHGQNKLSPFMSLDAEFQDQKEDDDDDEVRTLYDKIPQEDYLWRGLRRKDGARIAAHGVKILTEAMRRGKVDPDGTEFRVFMTFLDVFEQDYRLTIDNTPPGAPADADPVLLTRPAGPKDFREIAWRLGVETMTLREYFAGSASRLLSES